MSLNLRVTTNDIAPLSLSITHLIGRQKITSYFADISNETYSAGDLQQFNYYIYTLPSLQLNCLTIEIVDFLSKLLSEMPNRNICCMIEVFNTRLDPESMETID